MKRLGLCVISLVLFLLSFSLGIVAQDEEAIPLTQTFSSSDGLVYFNYPEGWLTRANLPIVMLATNARVLPTGSQLGQDQLRATIFIAPRTVINTVESGTPLTEIFEIITSSTVVATCEDFSPLETVLNNDIALSLSTQACRTSDNAFILRELERDSVGIIAASALRGEMEAFMPTLLAIASTMFYGEIESPLPEENPDNILSFIASDNAMTFDYPAIWQVTYDAPSNTATVSLPEGAQFTLTFFTNTTMDRVLEIIQVEQFDSLLKTEAMESIEIGDFVGFRIDVGDANDTIVIVDYLLDVGDTVIVHINFNPAPDNLAEIEQSILQLMASMETTIRTTLPPPLNTDDESDDEEEGSDI